MYFNITENPGKFAVKFDTPNQFWAIGFGEGMSEADVWVFEIIDDEIRARDTRSTGYSAPLNDED